MEGALCNRKGWGVGWAEAPRSLAPGGARATRCYRRCDPQGGVLRPSACSCPAGFALAATACVGLIGGGTSPPDRVAVGAMRRGVKNVKWLAGAGEVGYLCRENGMRCFCSTSAVDRFGCLQPLEKMLKSLLGLCRFGASRCCGALAGRFLE